MEKSLESLRPEDLTTRELARYASLYTLEQLPRNWVVEMIHRLTKRHGYDFSTVRAPGQAHAD